DVVLLHPHPGQLAALRGERVALAGESLFLGQQLLAGDQPLGWRGDVRVLDLMAHAEFSLIALGMVGRQLPLTYRTSPRRGPWPWRPLPPGSWAARWSRANAAGGPRRRPLRRPPPRTRLRWPVTAG